MRQLAAALLVQQAVLAEGADQLVLHSTNGTTSEFAARTPNTANETLHSAAVVMHKQTTTGQDGHACFS